MQINNVYSTVFEYKKIFFFESTTEISDYLKKIINIKRFEYETTENKTTIDLALRYIKENYNKKINMTIVANEVSVSYNHFSKIFKEKIGMNFSDYLTKIRMDEAIKLLSNPENKVNNVGRMVGYDNPKHFASAFKNYFGIAPNKYRRK